MYALRRRLDNGPQVGLTVPELVLHAFALIYVGVQDVPAENCSARATTGKTTNLKPTVHAVEASEARLVVMWLTRCDRSHEDLDDAREVVRMKRIADPPLLQFLERPAAVFDELIAEGVDASRRCQDCDQARDVAYEPS